MFPIPDTLAAFYLICFAVGFLFVVVSLFLGLGHDTLHLPGLPHGDAGGADVGGAGGGVDVGGLDHAGGLEAGDGGPGSAHSGGSAGHDGSHPGGHGMSPINLSTLMAFLTWFGGAGYILRVYAGFAAALSVAVATLAGLLGGAIIFYFMVRILLPGQRILDPEDYRMVGTVARVTVQISPERPGEVVFSMAGARRSEGARSVDGSAIGRGTEVVIVRYEGGLAYVEPWSSFVARG